MAFVLLIHRDSSCAMPRQKYKKTVKKHEWIMCSSKKHPYQPHERSSEIPSGRGILKVKILEGKYEAKLEIPGGTGVQNKKPSMEGEWTF